MLQEGPEEVWALVCVQEGSGHFLGQVMNSMGYEASDFRKRHGNEGCRALSMVSLLGAGSHCFSLSCSGQIFHNTTAPLKTVARARLLC